MQLGAKMKAGTKIPPNALSDAHAAYVYAHDVIKGRFPEGEPAIAQHAHAAYAYARDVLKGRFPEGEPVIAKDAEWAYAYLSQFFPDIKVTTRDEVDILAWEKAGCKGFFADSKLFAKAPSILDICCMVW